MTELVVSALDDVGYERWFDLGKRPDDIPKAVQRLKARRERRDQQPFWFVAIDARSEVCGRVAGYIQDEQRLTLWVPRVAPGYTDDDKSVIGALVRSCFDLARARPSVRFAECQPGHDSPRLASVLSALSDAGFVEVATAHEFDLELCDQPDTHDSTTLAITPYGGVPEILTDLFASVNSVTLDRAQATNRLDPDVTLRELERLSGASAVDTLWRLARLDGQPVGHVLSKTDGQCSNGHVLEIGVVPDARGHGVGKRLLGSSLAAMWDLGVRSITALIDDENEPSIRLFTGAGFHRQPGAYWTWRMDIH